MPEKHQVIFYPVGNGDTCQIILANQQRILLDYRHQQAGEDPDSPVIDLKGRLKEELKKVGRDYFDVVAFTHADSDHICGSTEFFELRHASKYQGEERVKIKELWVPAAMLLEKSDNSHLSEEFVLLRQEARFRLLEGRGIKVFSKPKALLNWLTPKLEERGEKADARNHLFVDAGTLVPGFSLDGSGVEFFCHSPFIKHCDNEDVIRNEASLIFNVRFRADGNTYDYLAVGDAEWKIFEEIYDISGYHSNLDRLDWNLFNIPHHCSYLALSDEKGDRETVPSRAVKEILLQGKANAYLVSSSRPILDTQEGREQVLPPHVQAKKAYERYLEEVGGRKFLVTMSEPNAQHPEPLVFEIGVGGVILKRSGSIGAPALIGSPAPRAG